jgi:hypothetical protein
MVPPSRRKKFSAEGRKLSKKSVKNGNFFFDFQKISPAAGYIVTKHVF